MPPAPRRLESLDPTLQALTLHYQDCNLCPRKCGVNRIAGERGDCGLDAGGRIYREYLHFGEEENLIPTYALYLTGCSLRCRFCSEWEPVTKPTRYGNPDGLEAVAQRICSAEKRGAKSVSFVGGEPIVNALYALRILRAANTGLPVVWNTNLYATQSCLTLLVPVIDLWLVDVKFGNDQCAARLSGMSDASAVVWKGLEFLLHVGAPLQLRHLLMPGHLECCTLPVVERLRTQCRGVHVNLMDTFLNVESSRSPLGTRWAEHERRALHTLRESIPAHWLWNGYSAHP